MNNVLENLRDGIYIPAIEACWLYKGNIETANYKVEKEHLWKLLKGKLDWSFELVENHNLIDNIEVLEDNGKLYTLDVVNVRFTSQYTKVENKKVVERVKTKELRDWCYKEGFYFNGNLMRNLKRSSGKARIGENVFALDSIVTQCLDWARMGLKFEGKQDIGGIRAYESLPLSSIIGTIQLNPKNILIIDDYESKFPWEMSKTWLENKELKTETKVIEESNSIWDGEGLLSSKILEQYDFLKDKGVALLRNRFMKMAGFSCFIEKYYRDYCQKNGLDYDTFEVENIDGSTIKVSDILCITTPSAIKIHKYNNEVLKIKGYEMDGEYAWLKYWKDNCGNTFGVAKTDKPSYLCKVDKDNNIIKHINVLSYQMVNTIPFQRSEISLLLELEKQYIERLKNDLSFFLQEVNQPIFENEEEIDETEIIEQGYEIDVNSAYVELVKKNPDFANTQVFKDYRRNFINSHIDRLRAGKIRIENTDYAIACGNPIEMLLATTGDFDGKSVTLQGNELYCIRFQDGEEIAGFRNPHVVAGNCGLHINRKIDLIDKYLNTTANIAYLNSIDYPTLSIYQGEDFDIDSNLLTNNSIIVNAVKRINHKLTPIPVNRVENSGKNNKEMTPKNISDVDHVIQQNFIGETINLSQEINSKINHLINTKTGTLEDLEIWYKRASCLSSISCVEIDKAKVQFKNLKVPKELEKMTRGLERIDEAEILPLEAKISEIKKEIYKKLNEIKQLREHGYDGYKVAVNEIKEDIRQLKCEINSYMKEINEKDTRRYKPYFFKYVGDNKVKIQRKKVNKSNLKKLNKATVEQFAKDNNIEEDKVNMKDKVLIKLLKENEKINKKWIEKQYVRMETPMDWVQEELDRKKNKKKVGTIQVIHLIKKNRNKFDENLIKIVEDEIKKLDTNIEAIKLDLDLKYAEKKDKINLAKLEYINRIKDMKITQKANIYGILKRCLNSCKNNGKIKKKSGIESITLEILFEVYGTGLLEMFV